MLLLRELAAVVLVGFYSVEPGIAHQISADVWACLGGYFGEIELRIKQHSRPAILKSQTVLVEQGWLLGARADVAFFQDNRLDPAGHHDSSIGSLCRRGLFKPARRVVVTHSRLALGETFQLVDDNSRR